MEPSGPQCSWSTQGNRAVSETALSLDLYMIEEEDGKCNDLKIKHVYEII